MLMLAAMRPAGTGGCAARYCEPSRPCSSAATAANSTERRGRWGSAAIASAIASIAATPARVVERAVVDRVLAGLGAAFACRGDRGGRCRAPPRRRARDRCRAAARCTFAVCLRVTSLASAIDQRHAQRHRPEVALLRRRRAARRGPGRPARRAAATRPRSPTPSPASRGSPSAGSVELLAGPRRLDHLPRVAGRGRGVDDDRARRAVSRRLLVLVVPAAVVEARLARRRARGRPRGRCSSRAGPCPSGPRPCSRPTRTRARRCRSRRRRPRRRRRRARALAPENAMKSSKGLRSTVLAALAEGHDSRGRAT